MKRIKDIHSELKERKECRAEAGRNRWKSIIHKLYYKYKTTKLHLNAYISALPHLQQYAKVFQTHETMVHLFHHNQKKVCTRFLSCYVKPEAITNKSPRAFQVLDCRLDIRYGPIDKTLCQNLRQTHSRHSYKTKKHKENRRLRLNTWFVKQVHLPQVRRKRKLLISKHTIVTCRN